MTPRRTRIWMTVGVLLLLYLMGLGTRRAVLETQYRVWGKDFPFTLESALHYRRVKIIHDTGTFPALDPMVGFPEGVDARKTYEFGSEYVQAAFVRCLPSWMSVGDRLRWIESGWFCLGIPFLAVWVYGLTGRRRAGLAAGMFYAVALSAVIRSTGQELSKENFALPLLIGHLACEVWSARTGRRSLSVASALLLGASLWSWDLIQFYVLLRVVTAAWSVWRSGSLARPGYHVGLAAAVVGVGLLSPYYRAHGLLYSPTCLMLFGVVAAHFLPTGRPWKAAAIVLPLALSPLLSWLSGYGESYSHFTGLLWSKLRWLNRKPADPGLLSFENRIMWVPALHSATLALTLRWFPAMLYTSLVSSALWVRERGRPEIAQLCFYYAVSLLTFFLFFRFHVFVAIFGAALTGCGWAWATERGGWKLATAVAVGAVAFLMEAGQTLYRPERWGRSNVYYTELNELNDWLRKHAAPDAVLANFGVSASIAAYGKCAVVLHPKFESPGIRQRVKSYGELLFKGDEASFRDWADDLGVEYYVHAKGEFSSQSPELQMRYFVNALNPPDKAPARLFEFHPERLTSFRFLWGNAKYSVFKMLTRTDEVVARRKTEEARGAFQAGDLDRAETSAIEALRRNPDASDAAELLLRISALREQGFESGTDAER